MKMLSIIIPIYNSEKYLNQCIDSILISKNNFELLLIDDGSTDKSYEICDKYEKKDFRVKVLHKKNGGVSSARNLGISNATGKYVMFVDSDDILINNWSKIFEYIVDMDVYYFCNKIKTNIKKEQLIRYITGCNDDKIFLSGPISKIYKRDFLINKRIFFDEKIINGEDMIFNIDVALSMVNFSIINFSFYNYRQNLSQSTRNFNKNIINSDMYFQKKIDMIFKNSNFNIIIAKEIKDFCLINAVILILNRISYIKKYSTAKEYYYFINKCPYKNIIYSKKDFVFKLCQNNKFRILFYYFKFKSKLSFFLKKKTKNEFIRL